MIPIFGGRKTSFNFSLHVRPASASFAFSSHDVFIKFFVGGGCVSFATSTAFNSSFIFLAHGGGFTEDFFFGFPKGTTAIHLTILTASLLKCFASQPRTPIDHLRFAGASNFQWTGVD